MSVAVAVPQRHARINLLDDNSFDYPLEQFGFDEREYTTPVPILRQLNTHNSDGSYSYGYESGDGTYKIETKYATGEVKGKYGYYDDTGLFREVEYGHTPTIPDPQSEPIISEPQQPPPPVSRATQPARTTVISRPRPRSSGLQQPTSQYQPRFAVRPAPQRPTFQAQLAVPQLQSHPFVSTVDWTKGVYSYRY